MSNVFNVLYHRYIEQIKLQQIQNYNNKHRDYLKRIGKHVNSLSMQKKDNNIQKKQKNNYLQYQRPIRTQQNQNQINNNGNYRNQNNLQKTKQNNKSNLTNKNKSQQVFEDRPIRNKNHEEQIIKYQKDNQIKERNNFSQQDRPLQPLKNQTKFIEQRVIKPASNSKNVFKNQFLSQFPDEQQNIILVQCSQGCGRKFKPQALQKHQKVCQKIFQQKRKQFKVDLVDDQAKKLHKKNQGKKQKVKQNPDKVPKWKRQSERFRAVLKVSQTGGSSQTLPQQQYDDRIQCGGCGRKFNQKAAQKHIPNCVKKAKKK